jgi:hypothetical protein
MKIILFVIVLWRVFNHALIHVCVHRKSEKGFHCKRAKVA